MRFLSFLSSLWGAFSFYVILIVEKWKAKLIIFVYFLLHQLWNSFIYTQIKNAENIVELIRWRQNLWIKRANYLYKNVQEMYIQTVMKDSIETTENFFAVNFDTCWDLLITMIRYFLYWTSALLQFCWKIESPTLELF